MSMRERAVYLDYAATTPMWPAAIEAMNPFFADSFGNPSGGHAAARAAKSALEQAREDLAGLLGVEPVEVVFTGGGTEADNLAVKGAARTRRDQSGAHTVITTAFEHKAVLASCDRLTREGFGRVLVPVDGAGIVDLDALADDLDEHTALVSVMLVNNEVGTIQPLDAVADLVAARAPRGVVHTDAVQAVPWLDVSRATQPAHLVSISAHKFGGPKGIGALVVRGGVPLEPLIEGGGQEQGLRSGTSDVAGAVAMAAALAATVTARDADGARLARMRDRLVDGLLASIQGSFENGERGRKVAGNAHVGFEGVEAEALLVMLDTAGVYAAAGSSCSSGAAEPSHVLAAMGVTREAALSSVRLSLGYASVDRDVDVALEIVPEAVAKLRASGTVR
jgi:cysteine desulfurase